MFRLSSFLHSLANFDDEYDGIKHWYLGLTDVGKKQYET